MVNIADSVESDACAVLVPDSAAVEHCAVVSVGSVGPRVVITVIRGEHHSIVETESISYIITIRVPRYRYHIVGRLA